jgi:hypothetical protein
MNLKFTEWGGVHLSHLAQDRNHWRALVNTVTNLRDAQNAGNFFTSLAIADFSSSIQVHGVSYEHIPANEMPTQMKHVWNALYTSFE